MNVVLDGLPLYSNRSGIYRYTSKLYEHLIELGIDVKMLQNPVVFRKPGVLPDWPGEVMWNRYYPYKIIRRFMKPNFLYQLPVDLFSNKSIDIVHGTNFIHYPVVNAKSVITIHDLAFMRYPEVTSDQIYKHHMAWVPYSAERCDRIIADSLQTKRDIVELLSIPEDKIDVVYLAADDHFRPVEPEEAKAVLQAHQLPDTYLLSVGTVEPRKNLITLLRAYKKMLDDGFDEARLVIVGPKGWKYNPIMTFIEENGLESRVIFTGYVPDDHLPAIYSNAKALVYPSIYEGFGLPLVEAMYCGVPIIASNLTSVPEIVGDAGLLFPPTDVMMLANLMKKILTEPALNHKFAQLSLARANMFTWTNTAQQTKAVYDKVLEIS